MSGQHTTDTLIPWSDSQRLRQIRRTLGWTQLDLSLHLGLSQKTIYAIEHGTLQGRRVYVQEILQTFFNTHQEIA
jgi:DNA-binding XRE family transcriptional regulator